jgi:hypothetical protein
MTVSSISVSLHDPRVVVYWQDAAARYHVWIDPETFGIKDDAIYKNPLVDNGAGYFLTRTLSPKSRANIATISKVFAHVIAERLIEIAREEAAGKAAASARAAYLREHVSLYWRYSMTGRVPPVRPADISAIDFHDASVALARALFPKS